MGRVVGDDEAKTGTALSIAQKFPEADEMGTSAVSSRADAGGTDP